MTAFIARMVVKPDCQVEFEEICKRLREYTYGEDPSAATFELMKVCSNDNLYFITATFRDDGAYTDHMRSTARQQLWPLVQECLAEEMEMLACELIGPWTQDLLRVAG